MQLDYISLVVKQKLPRYPLAYMEDLSNYEGNRFFFLQQMNDFNYCNGYKKFLISLMFQVVKVNVVNVLNSLYLDMDTIFTSFHHKPPVVHVLFIASYS